MVSYRFVRNNKTKVVLVCALVTAVSYGFYSNKLNTNSYLTHVLNLTYGELPELNLSGLQKCLNSLNSQENQSRSGNDTSGQQQLNKLRELRSKMAARLSLMKTICGSPAVREYLLDKYVNFIDVARDWDEVRTQIPFGAEFPVDRKRNFAWCKVPKAGSSALASAFMKFFNVTKTTDPYGNMDIPKLMPYLRIGEPHDKIRAFINVRHPFSRLLSAFRDRIHAPKTSTMFKKFKTLYGMKIIKKYRTEETSTLDKEYKDAPTFLEFLMHIAYSSPKEYNEHWYPYYLACAPCHIEYKSVIHLESLEEELPHLREALGVNLTATKLHETRLSEYEIKVLSRMLETSNVSAIRENLSENLHKLYFSSIPKELLKKAYNVLWMDFLLFNYTIHPYDTYVGNKKI